MVIPPFLDCVLILHAKSYIVNGGDRNSQIFHESKPRKMGKTERKSGLSPAIAALRRPPKAGGNKDLTFPVLSIILIHGLNALEVYRSGHNGPDSKSCPPSGTPPGATLYFSRLPAHFVG